MNTLISVDPSPTCSFAEHLSIDSELFDNGICDADSCAVEWRLDEYNKCSSCGSLNVDFLTSIKTDDRKDSRQADSGIEAIEGTVAISHADLDKSNGSGAVKGVIDHSLNGFEFGVVVVFLVLF